MRKLALLLAVPITLFALSFSVAPKTFAQKSSITNGLNAAAGTAGVQKNSSLLPIIANLIQVAIGFTGILLVVMLVYSGFLYFSAMGDSGKIEKAKKLIVYSITGVIIVVMSYAISSYVISALSDSLVAPETQSSSQ